MNGKDFNEKILFPRLEKCKETLATKEAEYSSGKDRFYNFRRAAHIDSYEFDTTTDIEVAKFLMYKHFVSFLDMIDNASKEIYPSDGMIDEKFGDLINYIILIEGMIKDNRG